MTVIKAMEEYYKRNNSIYGKGSPKNLWAHEDRQLVKFDMFLDMISFEHKSIFDVGCGYGDLFFYLKHRGVNFKSYSGIELIKEHYDVAVSKLPKDVSILCGDFLKRKIKSFDVFVLSGTLNFYVEGWLNFALCTIDKMWELANDSIIFNMRSSFGDLQPESIKPSF